MEQTAAMMIDNKTGAILSMIEGRILTQNK